VSRQEEYLADRSARPQPAVRTEGDAPERAESGASARAGRPGAQSVAIPPDGGASVLRLQHEAGNAAVSRLLGEEVAAGAEDHPSVLEVIGKGGAPLETGLRSEMEAGLGADFGDVRVHTDAPAAASAQSVQARAYTVGSDVVFGEGAYRPDSREGRHTIAHELTHVVQQRLGPVEGSPAGGGVTVSDPSDRFERAAEATAEEFMAAGQAQAAEAENADNASNETAEAGLQREATDETDEDAVKPTA
jgi:hypothetical protein